MTMARTAAEVLDEHTVFELECIDRMYLNAYVPVLQTSGGTAWFFQKVRGKPVPAAASGSRRALPPLDSSQPSSPR